MNGGPSASSDAPPPACTTDLTPFVTSLKVPGISGAIVKNGHVVCTAVAGKAVLPGNGRTEKAVTTDTDFLWASVSKTVTATAVMQLWERGKFQLDDSIDKYLGFSVRVPTCKATPITFRQLLTHTSSITDNDTVINSKPVAVSSGDPTVALDRLVKGYFTPGGEFYHTANFDSGCPGTQSDYSNMGVALLGYLVQVISGEDLYAYYQAHIFGPLGMKNTSFHLADLDAATLAAPLGTEAQYGEADFPDGMMRTSPVQLGKFLAMISQGGTYDGKQLLMPSTVKEMLKQQTALAPASTNGITQGLILYTVNKFGPVTWGHDGDDDGATSNMFFDPATKTGVILVSNGVWSGDPGAVPAMSALFGESAKY
jgi:CubicO group peptidase (beta-lactamase class C family)